MGTSGSYGGSTTGLVPSWVDDDPAAAPPGETAPPQTGGDDVPLAYPSIPSPVAGPALSSARASMTRGFRGADERAVRRSASQYVAARGGARGATRSMGSSRAVAAGIARFAQSVASEGVAGALRALDLGALVGAPVVSVFIALTDALCPPGGTIDEAIAREAMLETVAVFASDGVSDFDDLTADDLEEFFVGVVTRSIESKVSNEVSRTGVGRAHDLAAIEQAERMLHDFVEGCVRDHLSTVDSRLRDLADVEIDQFVSELYVASFDLMRTLGERDS